MGWISSICELCNPYRGLCSKKLKLSSDCVICSISAYPFIRGIYKLDIRQKHDVCPPPTTTMRFSVKGEVTCDPACSDVMYCLNAHSCVYQVFGIRPYMASCRPRCSIERGAGYSREKRPCRHCFCWQRWQVWLVSAPSLNRSLEGIPCLSCKIRYMEDRHPVRLFWSMIIGRVIRCVTHVMNFEIHFTNLCSFDHLYYQYTK